VSRKEEKWAIGQAGFRPKHSMVDHCLTLQHMIEKTRYTKKAELWCCFMDFRKAFDMAPERERLI
jgi:hypothetical protein